jgi:MbtH protein
MDETEDNTIYKVVLNHEEQYSTWPADRENAPGWNDAGKTGPKQSVWSTSKRFGQTCGR